MSGFTIKSRKLGQTFKFQWTSYYIWCNGYQICERGQWWFGNTLTARSHDQFEKKARRWYRQYLADMRRNGAV